MKRVVRKFTRKSPIIEPYCDQGEDDVTVVCEPEWRDATYSYAGTMTLALDGDSVTYEFRGYRAARACLKRHRVSFCRKRVSWG